MTVVCEMHVEAELSFKKCGLSFSRSSTFSDIRFGGFASLLFSAVLLHLFITQFINRNGGKWLLVLIIP